MAVALLATWLAAAAGAGELRGTVETGIVGLDLDGLGPVVVYLEPVDGGSPHARDAARRVSIRQRHATFEPSFRAVAAGSTVTMPNDDAIYHNVFSFSEPNSFDLGLYAAGESREVRLDHPGLVRIYCSIHESMNATVWVSPTPWFAEVDAEGRFTIAEVPAGEWWLHTWVEKLPSARQRVSTSGSSQVTVRLGELVALR